MPHVIPATICLLTTLFMLGAVAKPVPTPTGSAGRPDLTPAEYHASRFDDDPFLSTAIRLYFEGDYESALEALEESKSIREPSRLSLPGKKRRYAQAAAWRALAMERNGNPRLARLWAEDAIVYDYGLGMAHKVLAKTFDPAFGAPQDMHDDAYATRHYREAVEAREPDYDAWESVWVKATTREDREEQAEALQAMADAGLYPPALLAYNAWVMRSVPENAVLVTNGDMDTYPALVLQHVEGMRSDVAIINLSLLNLPGYSLHMARVHGLPWPASESDIADLRTVRTENHVLTIADQIVIKWVMMAREGEMDRPVAFATTVPLGNLAFFAPSDLTFTGVCYLDQRSGGEGFGVDVSALRTAMERADLEAIGGSYARYRSLSPVTCNPAPLAGNILQCVLLYMHEQNERGAEDEVLWALEYGERFLGISELGDAWGETLRQIRATFDGPDEG